MPHFISYMNDPYIKPTCERKKMHGIPSNNIVTKNAQNSEQLQLLAQF